MNDKDYDPFSYGQVRMAKTDSPGAGSPEDILFTSKPQPAATFDDSWDPPAADGVDFGADVLGERAQGATRRAAPATAAPAARPAPRLQDSGVRRAEAPAPVRGGPDRATSDRATSDRATGDRASSDRAGGAGPRGPQQETPAPARRAAAPRPQPQIMPVMPPPSHGPSATLVPMLVLAGGVGAGAWLHLALHNTVMAGIAAALGLALAGVTWFALRR